MSIERMPNGKYRVRVTVPVRKGTVPVTVYPKNFKPAVGDWMKANGITDAKHFKEKHEEHGLDKDGTLALDIGNWSKGQIEDYKGSEAERVAKQEQLEDEQRGG